MNIFRSKWATREFILKWIALAERQLKMGHLLIVAKLYSELGQLFADNDEVVTVNGKLGKRIDTKMDTFPQISLRKFTVLVDHL